MKNPSLKLPAGVSQEFVDMLQSMPTDELKATIVRLQVQNQENEAFKESEGYIKAEEEFKAAKEKHGYVVKPVKEVTTSIKNKTRLVVERMKERGQA